MLPPECGHGDRPSAGHLPGEWGTSGGPRGAYRGAVPRRRLAVAVLAPPVDADAVDVLRRAVGVPEPFHVPPHCTLVPPVNVAAAEDEQVDRHLRGAASGSGPFRLVVGPATTFAPETPTLHLAVGGTDEDLAALRALRSALRSGPFDRPDVWPFTPHVTLEEHHPEARIAGSVAALAGVRQHWSVDCLHLLEHRRRDDGSPYWAVVREEPLGGPALVGRGGLEVVLRTAGMVEEPVAALVGTDARSPLPGPGRPLPLAVVAERPGSPSSVTGAAVGTGSAGGTARLDAVVVDEGERGVGVGAQLLAAWCSAAAAQGAEVVVAPADDGFLARHGFVAVADLLVRRL
jgi:2'-5' RNA ligase